MQKNLSYRTCQLRHGSSNVVGVDFSPGSSSLLPRTVANWLRLRISILRCWQYLGGKLSILVCFCTGFRGELISAPPVASKNGNNVCIYGYESLSFAVCFARGFSFWLFKVHWNYNFPGTYATGNKGACENIGEAMPVWTTAEPWLFPGTYWSCSQPSLSSCLAF